MSTPHPAPPSSPRDTPLADDEVFRSSIRQIWPPVAGSAADVTKSDEMLRSENARADASKKAPEQLDRLEDWPGLSSPDAFKGL